jgi:uncharacterized protein with von Willebrand factor type A (vWA) domain
VTRKLRNIAEFGHALRAGGVRLGSGALLEANAAIAAVGVASQEDVRAALRATLVRDPADLALFDLLFDAFFARRSFAVPGSEPITPQTRGPEGIPGARRLSESLAALRDTQLLQGAERREQHVIPSFAAQERLANKDFEQMTAAELGEARRLIEAAPPRRAQRRTRRWDSGGSGGQLDLAGMLRKRRLDVPLYRERRWRLRDWVLLVDISGSMAVYSRMFLHFAHSLLLRRGGRVEVFTFATRLTHLTRELAANDPDAALRAATRKAPDWDGGTRLGQCIAEFNFGWARRTLSRGAQLLLFTDGLEREDIGLLDAELARLRRSCRELIWVNPLMRHKDYEPLAAGAAALERHAHRRVSAHNVQSVLALLRLIDAPPQVMNSARRA